MGEILIPKLSPHHYIFPNPREASKKGLLAWGDDLSPDRVMAAYMVGIFPWYNEGDPVLWWSPDPRLVLFPKEIKISKSLRQSMKRYRVTFDQDFRSVIELCRDIRHAKGEGTWILEEVIETYETLHVRDLAHSVEVYEGDELVGGLYGICMGKVFCGESMFSLKRDASKVALAVLCEKLGQYDFEMIDCQIPSNHLKRLGAHEMSREEFLIRLEIGIEKPNGFKEWRSM